MIKMFQQKKSFRTSLSKRVILQKFHNIHQPSANEYTYQNLCPSPVTRCGLTTQCRHCRVFNESSEDGDYSHYTKQQPLNMSRN